jgi:hypothetical protein
MQPGFQERNNTMSNKPCPPPVQDANASAAAFMRKSALRLQEEPDPVLWNGVTNSLRWSELTKDLAELLRARDRAVGAETSHRIRAAILKVFE